MSYKCFKTRALNVCLLILIFRHQKKKSTKKHVFYIFLITRCLLNDIKIQHGEFVCFFMYIKKIYREGSGITYRTENKNKKIKPHPGVVCDRLWTVMTFLISFCARGSYVFFSLSGCMIDWFWIGLIIQSFFFFY